MTNWFSVMNLHCVIRAACFLNKNLWGKVGFFFLTELIFAYSPARLTWFQPYCPGSCLVNATQAHTWGLWACCALCLGLSASKLLPAPPKVTLIKCHLNWASPFHICKIASTNHPLYSQLLNSSYFFLKIKLYFLSYSNVTMLYYLLFFTFVYCLFLFTRMKSPLG